jgi:hypothetical protein
MLDSPEGVCAGQAGFEYPATSVPFSSKNERDFFYVPRGVMMSRLYARGCSLVAGTAAVQVPRRPMGGHMARKDRPTISSVIDTVHRRSERRTRVRLILVAIVGASAVTALLAPGLNSSSAVPDARLDPADSSLRPEQALRPTRNFATIAPGARLPTDKECTDKIRRSSWEPRPENRSANRTIPEKLSLGEWEGFSPEVNQRFLPRINGRFTGTTDEIIQWASCKWGIETDIVRAMAVRESFWRQAATGDIEDDQSKCAPGYHSPCPTSFGLLQIKHFYFPGTWPYARTSTAFNVDYVLAKERACLEGGTYYKKKTRGDLWGCVGFHFSGGWRDKLALGYIERVKSEYLAKPWRKW